MTNQSASSYPNTFLADQNRHEGVIGLALNGQIRYANQAAAIILGFETIEELTNDAGPFLQNIQLVSTVNLSTLMSNLPTNPIEGEPLLDMELDLIRQNNNQPGFARYTLYRSALPGQDESGYLISLLDIGHQREKQVLREELAAALSDSSSKTHFFASLNHELRTPLNGVNGALDLLNSTGVNRDQSRYLTVAKTSTRLLEDVITSIMDVTAIQAGQLALVDEEFSVANITDDAMRSFAAPALQKALDYRSSIAATVPDTLIGDAPRIKQILGELLNNAVRHTESGSVTATIDCCTLENGQISLSIAISDTGPGLSEIQLCTLQELFSKSDSELRLQHGGARLGLTLCNQLTGLMEGHIRVESAVNQGSTFCLHLDLPVVSAAIPSRSSSNSSDTNYRTVIYTFDRESISNDDLVEYRFLNDEEVGIENCLPLDPTLNPEDSDAATQAPLILVAEDNKINQLVASETLLGAGYRVLLADNGEEALAHLETSKIDLVLMDCEMPVLDGFETTRSIRTSERDTGILFTQQLPIIALTANTARGDREKCLVCGMNDYISKPFEPAFLFEVLDQYVHPPVQREQMLQRLSA